MKNFRAWLMNTGFAILIRENINTLNSRREIIVCEFMVSISDSKKIENIIRTKKANKRLNFVFFSP